MSKRNKVLFSQLPDEIFLQIFAFLSDANLLILSSVSHRFNNVALSRYLSNHNFSFSDNLLKITPENCKILCGLSHAIFIKSIKHLSLELDFPDTTSTELQNLSTLLRGMTNIGFFSLKLTARQALSPFAPVLRPGEGRVLRDALHCMLDHATQISQTVRVLGGELLHFSIIDRAVEWGPFTRFSRSLLTVPRGASRRLQEKHPGSVMSLFTRPLLSVSRGVAQRLHSLKKKNHSGMHTFEIHSICLVTPPLCVWTLRMLHASSISTLSFRHCDLNEAQWSTILLRLNIPTLASLILMVDNVALVDISRFVGRHTCLLKLELDVEFPDTLNQHTNSTDTNIGLRKFNLGNLTTFSAPPHILCTILPKSKPNKLRDITIRWPLRTTAPLLDIPHIDAYLPRDVALGLRLHMPSYNINVNAEEVLLETRYPISPGVTRISSIVVDASCLFEFNKECVVAFVHWLAMFPRLRRLVLGWDPELSMAPVGNEPLAPVCEPALFVLVVQEMMNMGPGEFKDLKHIVLQGEEKTYNA